MVREGAQHSSWSSLNDTVPFLPPPFEGLSNLGSLDPGGEWVPTLGLRTGGCQDQCGTEGGVPATEALTLTLCMFMRFPQWSRYCFRSLSWNRAWLSPALPLAGSPSLGRAQAQVRDRSLVQSCS